MLENNFNSVVDYDLETEYSCEESGCNLDVICRCSRIVDSCVKSVNMLGLTHVIYKQLVSENRKVKNRDLKLSRLLYGGEVVDLYCINRILVINKVYDTSFWKVGVSSGYYGDEVGDITLNGDLLNLIFDQCVIALDFDTLKDKLLYVLNLEYGYVLDDLSECDFEIIEIYKSHIDFKMLNQNHIKLVKMQDLSFYDKNFNLPRGIIRGEIDNYKIIDGFHRIIASEDRTPFLVFSIKK